MTGLWKTKQGGKEISIALLRVDVRLRITPLLDERRRRFINEISFGTSRVAISIELVQDFLK